MFSLYTDDIDSIDLHTKRITCDGIVLGRIAMPLYSNDTCTCDQRSQVLERDNNYKPTWMTLVLKHHGSCFSNIDVMVSADKTLREVLRVVTTHLCLRSDKSTRLIF